ncbi:hypothetical protein DFJ43DRAFT_1087465 [Lentinula guzmanii]|uniref:Uncharacterized protein n=1 Tax=Lentinula guzmanii TaxID=2804957 RepID=A0AA38JMH5_9AGAR|nr:hypothetical protein DFJ43DRAFT_1087465 [Lentinula guzmanii]
MSYKVGVVIVGITAGFGFFLQAGNNLTAKSACPSNLNMEVAMTSDILLLLLGFIGAIIDISDGAIQRSRLRDVINEPSRPKLPQGEVCCDTNATAPMLA